MREREISKNIAKTEQKIAKHSAKVKAYKRKLMSLVALKQAAAMERTGGVEA